MRFAVVMPDPAHWIHARAFDEVAEIMQAGLLERGHSCERAAVADRGRQILRQRPQAALLAPALAGLSRS